MNDMSHEQKTYLVTGATSGVGHAVAADLATGALASCSALGPLAATIRGVAREGRRNAGLPGRRTRCLDDYRRLFRSGISAMTSLPNETYGIYLTGNRQLR